MHTCALELKFNLPCADAPAASPAAAANVLRSMSAPLVRPISVFSPRYECRNVAGDLSSFNLFFNPAAKSSGTDSAESGKDAARAQGGTTNSLEDDSIDAESAEYLEDIDPKEWKKQDHYIVLGLQKLRYKATPIQIKNAFRKQILRYHPDKIAASAHDTNKDAIFKCVQKAHDILSNPVKRMQYDSVDYSVETSDMSPSSSKLKAYVTSGKFYKKVQKIFDLEERFSRLRQEKGTRMPCFGNAESKREVVDKFYSAWFSFQSMRSFEYEDKEDVECMDNRENKRYVDRKNKAERERKKNEDQDRLLDLIERVQRNDPRIKLFKDEEKRLKEESRRAKATARLGSASLTPAASTSSTASPQSAKDTDRASLAAAQRAAVEKAMASSR